LLKRLFVISVAAKRIRIMINTQNKFILPITSRAREAKTKRIEIVKGKKLYNGFFCGKVKEMNFIHIQNDFHDTPYRGYVSGIDYRNKDMFAAR